MATIYNQRRKHPADAIYVGRGTKFGNPFRIGLDGTREEVIEKFRRYAQRHPSFTKDDLLSLRGKDLVCWCAPLPCHASVLMELADEPEFREGKGE